MRYSYIVEQAIRAASVLHAGQSRKGPVSYPYITHLFAITMIVSDYIDDENTIAASLLHETLSDSDYSATELETDFGGQIRDLVVSITEPDYHEAQNSKELQTLQKAYLKQIKDASENALIILAASKVHTMRTRIEDYHDDMSMFIADFGPNHDQQLFLYQEISNALNRKLQSAILSEFNDIFTEYKNFINEVKIKTESY